MNMRWRQGSISNNWYAERKDVIIFSYISPHSKGFEVTFLHGNHYRKTLEEAKKLVEHYSQKFDPQ